jgi:hypothetical protein
MRRGMQRNYNKFATTRNTFVENPHGVDLGAKRNNMKDPHE